MRTNGKCNHSRYSAFRQNPIRLLYYNYIGKCVILKCHIYTNQLINEKRMQEGCFLAMEFEMNKETT